MTVSFKEWEKDVGEIIWSNAVIAEGEVMPFLNRSFMQDLKKHNIGSWMVFEWGSGFSTLWFGKRVKKMVSVENDTAWYRRLYPEIMRQKLPIDLIMRDLVPHAGCPYTFAINEYDKFDMIIIDGRNREECGQEAIKHLRPGGWIVLDDSQRERYGALRVFLTAHASQDPIVFAINSKVRGMANETTVWGFK